MGKRRSALRQPRVFRTSDGLAIFSNPLEDDEFFALHGRYPRSKSTHPYSYDPFLFWKKPGATHCSDSMYSDRAWSWWRDKLTEASKRFLPKNNEWGNRLWDLEQDPKMEMASKILSAGAEKELEIVRVDEMCNVATGYPVWLIFVIYKDSPKESLREMKAPGVY